MPIEQESRADYLQALLQQKKQLNANDNNMLNPGVSNDIENQAMLDTTINQKTSVDDIEKPEEKDTSSGNWFTNLINKAEGFLTNMANSFLTGVFGAVEGVVDLGANIIGAIGEGTGWYESKPFNDFVETDYAKGVADFMTDTLGYGISGIINAGRNISEYGTDYLKDAFTNPSVVKDKYHTGLYGNDNLTPNRNIDNEVEEFSMGVAQSIGFMLPTIVTAGASGISQGMSVSQAAANASKLAQNLSLLQMGISAAGKGAEEAIQEGATASQALGYGAASGAIEVVSEKLVGGVLDKLGIGEGMFGGLIGSKGGKKTIGKFIGNMFNEGAEEVFSAVLEPFTKAIYKGSDSLEQLKSSDFWIGTNGKFNQSVLGQFTSGAVTAGIMGGISTGALVKELGTDNYKTLNKFQEMVETTAEYEKEKNPAKKKQLADRYGELVMEFEDLAAKSIATSDTNKLKKLAQYLSSPIELAKALKNSTNENINDKLKEHIKFIQKQTSNISKQSLRSNFYNDIQRQFGTDYTVEFGDIENDNNAYVDSKNKVIRINDKLVAEKGGALLSHEYFGHVLGDNLSSASRQALYNSIRNTEWYKKIESKLVNAYQINDEYYQKLDSQTKKNTYYQDEVIAKYLEDVFGNKDTAQTIKHLKKVFSQPTLIDRILGVFNKSRSQFNTPNIVKEYAKTINKTIDALYKINKNNTILKALFKEQNGYKLTDSENKIKSEYKNLFDLVKEKKAQPQLQFSKNLEIETDEEFEKWMDDYLAEELSKELDEELGIEDVFTEEDFKSLDEIIDEDEITEQEAKEEESETYEEYLERINQALSPEVKDFFKDSVVKSNRTYWFDGVKDGKYLIPMYHGTPNSDMYFFDSKRIGENGVQRGFGFYLTDNISYADTYTGNDEGKVITAFVNITKPMSETKITITKEQLKKFFRTVDPNGDDYLSAYGDAYKDYEGVLGKTVDSLFKTEQSDADIINEIYGVMNADYDEYFNEVTKQFGFDGILFKNRAEGTIVVAFRSNQIKDINNVNPTENPDIRYSKAITEDNLGRQLTPEQQELFKDVSPEMLDENGNLKTLYHGTSKGGFGIFDNSNKQESADFYNSNTVAFFTDRIEDGADKYGSAKNIIKGKDVTAFENKKANFLSKYEKLKTLSGDSFMDYYNEISNEYLELTNNKYFDTDRKLVTSNIVKDGDKYVWIYAIGKTIDEQWQQEKTEYDGKYYRPRTADEIKKQIIDNIYNNIYEYDEANLNGIYEVYLNIKNPLVIEVEDNEENKWYKFKPSFINDALLNEEVQKADDKTLATDGVVLWTLKHKPEYDGIVIKGVRDSTKNPTNVYVTLKSPNQIKATDNLNPTDNPDIRYSKKIEDLSQEKYEVGKPKTKKTPNTYTSIETTKDLLDLVKSRIVGEEYNLAYPKTYRDFMSKTFTELNKVRDIDKTVDRIMNLLKETTVEYFNEETQKYEKIGLLSDIVNEKEWQSLRNDVKRIIQYAPETQAENKYTLKFEERLNKLTESLAQNVNRAGRVRVLNNKLTRIKKNVDRFYEATDDDIARNGLKALYAPLARLKGSPKGFKVGNLKAEINDILEWYTPDKIADRFETLPYDDEIRYQLEELYESLGEPKPIEIKKGANAGTIRYQTGNLSTEQINKCIDIINLIDAEIRNQTRASIENKAYANSTLNKVKQVKSWKELNILFKAIKKWKRGFAPSYVLVKEILGGNSPLARLLTTDIQNATSNNIMYKGKYFDKLKAEMKKLGIKQRDINKKITLANGLELTTDQALYLYISLNTETNFNEINTNGFEFLSDNKLSETYGKNEAQQYLDELERLLPDNVKKIGNFLQTFMNTDIKQDYINWYEMRYGKFEGRNEIGRIGDNTYWMLNRSYQYGTNAEKVVKTPAGVFKNSISRTGSNNAILLGGAFSAVQTYIDRIGTEIYLKPIYRQAYQILNTKVDNTTIYKQLMKTDVKDVNYLQTTLNDVIGANQKQTDLLSQLMGAFSVAKLSLNIGSMMKQFASIYTSNIPIRKSTKAIISRMFNKTAREEFKKLVDEIGAIKYREGINAAVEGNVGQVQGVVKTIADMGMIGIKKIDYATIGLGAYSLMVIGQDQYDLKIGTQENIDFVKEHWNEFDITQINNNALSKNAVSRGDYGQLAKLVFSFMQGANRAAFGSQINKVALWRRNHTLDKQVLKNNVRDLENEIKNFKNENSINNSFDELSLEDDVRSAYIELQAQLKQAQDSLKDYEAYEIAGGNTIPLHMASGLIAQGIFVALINELMKHIKGKKDWDEWDIFDLGADTLLAIGVDWIPFVNVISNWVKGYDVQIPAIEIMNEIVDVIQNAKSGNWQTMIRQLALLIGDTTGIPFQTLYQYMYGAVKTFDPSIAWQMNSVLYGSSIQSSTKTLNHYIEKQDSNKTYQMLSMIMDNYKVKSNETINKELTRLSLNGYSNALPKSYMTEYTDDKGNTIQLTSNQINAFRNYYNQATKSVNELMNINDYKNMTDEDKSKVIKKIYDSYYAMAKAKTLKIKADSKLGNYLLYSNQNAKIGQISLVLGRINNITDTKLKTRKELVFDYVNKLSGFSKGEKLLILYFAGYTSSANNNIFKAYLRNVGFTNSAIKEFLG